MRCTGQYMRCTGTGIKSPRGLATTVSALARELGVDATRPAFGPIQGVCAVIGSIPGLGQHPWDPGGVSDPVAGVPGALGLGLGRRPRAPGPGPGPLALASCPGPGARGRGCLQKFVSRRVLPSLPLLGASGGNRPLADSCDEHMF